MHTPLSLVVLSIFTVAASTPAGPKWLREYSGARELGRIEEKPMAVFIGSGTDGWNIVSREGKLDSKVMEILTKDYVCLYIDTKDEDGKQLASAFDVDGGLGLVISSHGGRIQAFRHQGDLENDDLARYFRRYADSERVVSQTESPESDRNSIGSPPQIPAVGTSAPFGGPTRTC